MYTNAPFLSSFSLFLNPESTVSIASSVKIIKLIFLYRIKFWLKYHLWPQSNKTVNYLTSLVRKTKQKAHYAIKLIDKKLLNFFFDFTFKK